MSKTVTRDPPISHRLGKERQKRFDAFWAQNQSLSRSDALNRLIDLGLAKEGFAAPDREATIKTRWGV